MKSFVLKALVAVLLGSLLPIYWIAFRAPAVGIFHDDGIYLVTAKALAEGKGYRIISLPGELHQTKYPILFPAVLCVAWKIFPRFPDNAQFIKALPLLFAILWLWLSYKLIREETGSPGVALWIVLLTATSSWVVFFSTTFMSETLFACLTAGALIWLKRLEGGGDNEGIGRNLLISSTFAAASFLTRTAGAPLVAAGTVSLFLKRKYIPGVMYLFGCTVLIAPWFWWQLVYGNSSLAIDPYYTLSNYNSWNILWNFTVEQKIHILTTNLLRIIFSPIALLNLDYNVVGFLISLVLMFLTCFGFIRDIRQDIKSLHLFILFYFGIIIMWAWPPERFLLPMIPFLLFFAYNEFSRICGGVFKSGTIRNYVYSIFAVLLGFQMITGLLLRAKETIKRESASFRSEQDDWRPIRELLDWVRQNTPEDSVLLGNLDPAYYLYTGRKAVRGFSADPYLLFYSKKPETALGEVPDLIQRIVAYRVRYIVRTPSRFYSEGPIFNGILDRLLFEFPEAFHIVKEGSVPSSKIYEVDQEILLLSLRSGGVKGRDGNGNNNATP